MLVRKGNQILFVRIKIFLKIGKYNKKNNFNLQHYKLINCDNFYILMN